MQRLPSLLMLCWMGSLLGLMSPVACAQADAALAPALVEQVRDWRRDFHQHPELGNRAPQP